MKKLFLLFLITFGVAVYAQTEDAPELGDFVIKTNGDTVFGKFKYLSGEGDIKTKLSIKVNDTLKVSLKASEIKYFRSGKDEYTTFQPDGEEGHYFIKILVIGAYLELYEWQVPGEISGGSKIEYIPYLRKGGKKEFTELDLAYWKKHLPEFIDDYEELADEVWKGKYKLEELDVVVKKYNEWKEENK